ncbi:MAG TPA: A24 family peptidase [Polyangiaceae bacterium]|jgi:prepilin peptidase CpaA|nr:MAG: Type IV leader peptidase family protein [Deltaproteobacteria bacterium ADurb.Bin207]HNS99982.1 A24 family peptidase [Polyangiaceae bacterium]HNZ23738.1 A24 family peptidase [Polyangiaceae bacterium]HOD23055.1 A24 family peptidase [Polyangiaceae bacterium]HOE48963.1 A24 family peptidase [Polyangiaceae bacterium]
MSYAKLFLVAAVVVTAIAAWTDFKKGIIPNWLSLGALVIAPILHGVLGGAYQGVRGVFEGAIFSLLGALACGAVPMLLYAVGGGRGGDVKLLAAVGALCRPVIGIEAVFYGFLVAAIYAQARLAYEGKLLQTLGNTAFLAINPFLPKARRRKLTKESMTWTRLGPSVFVGTAIAVLLNWSIP